MFLHYSFYLLISEPFQTCLFFLLLNVIHFLISKILRYNHIILPTENQNNLDYSDFIILNYDLGGILHDGKGSVFKRRTYKNTRPRVSSQYIFYSTARSGDDSTSLA